MANSFTINLNLTKPEVGADSNLWGGHLNGDMDILDSIFTSVTTMLISTVLKSDTSIADAAVTTKRVLFNLTGITPANTRNLSVQDFDGTLAYTAQVAAATTGLGTVTTGQVAAATVGLMDLVSVQTATNKTLTAPLLTGILAASTGVTTTAGDNSTKLATTAYVDITRIPGAMTTNALSGNVALNNASNYFDGPVVSQGTTGTWFVSGSVTLNNGGGAVAVKLWDGTTVIDSGEVNVGSTNDYRLVSLSGFITSPAGNLRISAKSVPTDGLIVFNASGNSMDSTISAVRIA